MLNPVIHRLGDKIGARRIAEHIGRIIELAGAISQLANHALLRPLSAEQGYAATTGVGNSNGVILKNRHSPWVKEIGRGTAKTLSKITRSIIAIDPLQSGVEHQHFPLTVDPNRQRLLKRKFIASEGLDKDTLGIDQLNPTITRISHHQIAVG